MAMKDYNSINFKNNAIDRMSGSFGKGDEPTDRKKNRLMKKADKMMNSALKDAQSLRDQQGKSSSLERYVNSKKS
jgi:hypothetical protein